MSKSGRGLSLDDALATVTQTKSGPTSNPGTETDDPTKAYWDSIKQSVSDLGSGIVTGLKRYVPHALIEAPPAGPLATPTSRRPLVMQPDVPTGRTLKDQLHDLTDPKKGGEVIGELIPQLLVSMGGRLPGRSIANTVLNAGATVAESPITNIALTPKAAYAGKLMRAAADMIGRTPSATPSPVDRYMPNQSGRPSGYGESAAGIMQAPESPVDRYMANQSGSASGYGESAAGVRLPENPVDRYMANTGGTEHATFAPSADDVAALQSIVDRYMPNTGGAEHGTYAPSADDVATIKALVDRYMPNRSGAESTPARQPSTGAEGAPARPVEEVARELTQRLGLPSEADVIKALMAKGISRSVATRVVMNQKVKGH